MKKKLIPILIGAAVFVAAVCVGALLLFAPRGNLVTPQDGYSFYLAHNVCFRGDKLVTEDFPGTGVLKQPGTYTSSLDHSSFLFLTFEQELYLIHDDELRPLTEDPIHYALANMGRYASYVDRNEDLYLYDAKTGSCEFVDEGVSYCCLSPDGKTMAYITRTGDSSTAWLRRGSDTTELGEDIVPFCISNAGKSIFCIDLTEDGTLYLADTSGKLTQIYSGDRILPRMTTNADHTQLTFMTETDRYCYRKGELYRNDAFTVALCASTNETHMQGAYICSVRASAQPYCVIESPTYDFADCYFWAKALYYVDKDMQVHLLEEGMALSSSMLMKLTRDGKTVVYVSPDNKLYRATGSETDRFAKDVLIHVISPDGKTVYYIDLDHTLWYMEGDDGPRKVDDQVYRLAMTADRRCVYSTIEDDGDHRLYSAFEGRKERLISGCTEILPLQGTDSVNVITSDEDREVTVYAIGRKGELKEIFSTD